MLPDLDCLEYHRLCRGKAFTALVTSQGIGVQSRSLSVDGHEWDSCQQCPVYRTCHDLCMAKLGLTLDTGPVVTPLRRTCAPG